MLEQRYPTGNANCIWLIWCLDIMEGKYPGYTGTHEMLIQMKYKYNPADAQALWRYFSNVGANISGKMAPNIVVTWFVDTWQCPTNVVIQTRCWDFNITIVFSLKSHCSGNAATMLNQRCYPTLKSDQSTQFSVVATLLYQSRHQHWNMIKLKASGHQW